MEAHNHVDLEEKLLFLTVVVSKSKLLSFYFIDLGGNVIMTDMTYVHVMV